MADVERVARLIHSRHGFFPWEEITERNRDYWRGTAAAVLDLIAATPSHRQRGGSGGDHGAGSRLPHGEGPQDGHVAAPAGPEGTLPAPKDTQEDDRG